MQKNYTVVVIKQSAFWFSKHMNEQGFFQKVLTSYITTFLPHLEKGKHPLL